VGTAVSVGRGIVVGVFVKVETAVSVATIIKVALGGGVWVGVSVRGITAVGVGTGSSAAHPTVKKKPTSKMKNDKKRR
jgi:hypothetical protein